MVQVSVVDEEDFLFPPFKALSTKNSKFELSRAAWVKPHAFTMWNNTPIYIDLTNLGTLIFTVLLTQLAHKKKKSDYCHWQHFWLSEFPCQNLLKNWREREWKGISEEREDDEGV